MVRQKAYKETMFSYIKKEKEEKDILEESI